MAKKKKNTIRFVDSFNLKPQITPEVKDFYQGEPGSQKSVRIRVAATHAGKITKNNGFYLPHRMRDGAQSFVAQYKKPIQVHHESHEDPVGRVVSARYVDISGGISDSIKDSVKQSTFDAFLQGNMSKRETVDYALDHFIHDEAISEDPDYEGLGYIELVADITDPDAVQKVLDGRYLTGSVGASTDSAVCSVCKQDWAGEDGRCEHIPGRVYDKKKCVIIAGDLQYDEWSFVNKPADTHASVIEVNVGGIEDSVKIEEHQNEELPEVTLNVIKDDESNEPVELKKNKEAIGMLFKDALATAKADERFVNLPNLEDEVKKLVDENNELDEEKLLALLAEKLPADTKPQDENVEDKKKCKKKKKKMKDEDEESEEDSEEDSAEEDTDEDAEDDVEDSADETDIKDDASEEDIQDAIDPVKEFFGDEYDEIVGDDEWGREYAEMLLSLLDNASDEERDKYEFMIKEAKMSSEKRKSLPDSAFCGPNRSFPVNDCAHYTAALRLLGRYKGPGSKDSIRACIERKGKRMGCGSKESDEVKDELNVGDFTLDYFDRFEDEQLVQMVTGLVEALKERDLTADCTPCDDDQAVDNKDESDEETKKLKDRLASTQKEVRYLHEDIERLNDALADSQDALRVATLEKIADYRKLSGEAVDVKEITDSFKDKSMDDINASLKDLSGKVDMEKIADTLNSGLTNNPQGSVADPTLKMEDNTTDKPKSVKPNRAVLEQAAENYLTIRIRDGEHAAEMYLASLKMQGVLSQDVKEFVENQS